MTEEHEEFLRALRELEPALDRVVESVEAMRQRLREIMVSGEQDRPLRESVPEEQRPLLVQLLTQTTEELHASGNRVRTSEARALYSEGMTMDEIARLFGVSRQRVSTLLRGRNN